MTQRKKNMVLLNQVMLSKFWYLMSVEKLPANIIQNIRKDIYDFLWNWKKVSANRNTITLPIKMRGLSVMDTETYPILWDFTFQYRKVKQYFSIFNTHTHTHVYIYIYIYIYIHIYIIYIYNTYIYICTLSIILSITKYIVYIWVYI